MGKPQEMKELPQELGGIASKIAWVNLSSEATCSFERAIKEARRTKKPLLVNFVEFPG